MSVYIVRSGDTLGAIASKHGATLAEIFEANPQYRSNPNNIQIGWSIQIPEEKPPEEDPKAMDQVPHTQVTQFCGQNPVPPVNPLIYENVRAWDEETLLVHGAEKKVKRMWDQPSCTLDIVQSGPKDTITIEYKGPNPPAELTIKRNKKEIKKVAGSGKYEFDVTYAPMIFPYPSSATSRQSLALKKLIGSFFLFGMEPTIYEVEGLEEGGSKVPLKIRVYCPDQWKMGFKLPQMKSYKVGREWKHDEMAITETHHQKSASIGVATGTNSASVQRSSSSSSSSTTTTLAAGHDNWNVESSGWGQKTTKTSLDSSYSYYSRKMQSTAYKEGEYVAVGPSGATYESYFSETKSSSDYTVSQTESSIEHEVGGSKPLSKFFWLKLNDRQVNLAATGIIGSVIMLLYEISKLMKAMKELKSPKIGWFFEFDFQFMQGSFELMWGWRESDESSKVYRYVGGQASLTILDVTIKGGFGFAAGGLEAQLIIEANGKIEYKTPAFETKGPDHQPDGKYSLGTFKGATIGKGYAHVKAAGILTIDGGLEASLIVVDGEVYGESKKGLCIQSALSGGEVKLFFSLSSFGTRPKNYEQPLLDAVDFGSYTFPGDRRYSFDEVDKVEDIRAIFHRIFSAGWFPIEFYAEINVTEQRKKYLFFGDETTVHNSEEIDLDQETITNLIAGRVWNRRDKIDMDKKVIEGIAYAVLEDLVEIYGKRVETDQFIDYTGSSRFDTVLEEAQSPAKDYQTQFDQE